MTNGRQRRRRQGIFWLLTIPHPCDAVPPILGGELGSTGLVWLKGQLERGESSGYLHYQFVCAFATKQSLSAVKRVFGSTAHGELSRSAAANDYCCKESTRVEGPWEIGCKPICRNEKTDWESVWTLAKSGALEDVPASVRVLSYSALRRISADYAVPICMERVVYVFWGATGTGKSRRAWDEAGVDAYPKDPRNKFWDGYRSHSNVVIDEFRGSIDVAHLLRWFDRYPVCVEVKGSSRPLNAERIWITSNLDPRSWYPDLDQETLAALMRRLTITHFN